MTRINFLPPWVETNCQPAFYDKESGTVLQQVARMYAKVNQLVRNVNEQNEAIELYIAKFIELKDYVEDYFDNLDVQEEINNKLDQMAEDGQLADIIAQYLGLAGVLAFSTVADMKQAENLVNGSSCKTAGYYSVNDGGAGYYKVREVTNEDVVDEGKLIALHDDQLVAELIIENEIHSKQFGVKGDNTTDATARLNYFFDLPYNKIIDDGTYLISSTVFIKGTWNTSQTADKFSVKFEKCSFNYQGTAGNPSFIIYNTRHSIIDGLNIDITSNSNKVYIIGSYETEYNNFAIKDLSIVADDTLLSGKTFTTANIQHITFNNCIVRGVTTFDSTNTNYYLNAVNFNESMLNGNTTNTSDTSTWVSDLVVINGKRFNENLNFTNCDLSYSTVSIFAINTKQDGEYTNSLSKACINCNNCYFDSSVNLVKNYDNKNMTINLIGCKMSGNNIPLNPSIYYKDYLKNTQITSSDVFPDHLPAGNMNLAYNGDMSTAGVYGSGSYITGSDGTISTKSYETSSRNIHNRCRQIVLTGDLYLRSAMVTTPSEGIYTFGVRFMVTSGNASVRLVLGTNGEATGYIPITNNKEYFLSTNKSLQEFEANTDLQPKIHVTGATAENPITIQIYEVIVTPGKFILPNTPLHAGAVVSE